MRLVSYNPAFSAINSGRGMYGNGDFPIHMDVINEEESYKIVAEMAGVDKDKIKIRVENDILTISGERYRDESEADNYVLKERFFGKFKRSFRLPEKVDKSGISADYKNGLLEVSLPLKAEQKPRQIEVAVS